MAEKYVHRIIGRLTDAQLQKFEKMCKDNNKTASQMIRILIENG